MPSAWPGLSPHRQQDTPLHPPPQVLQTHPKAHSAQSKRRLVKKYLMCSILLRLTCSHFHACRWLHQTSALLADQPPPCQSRCHLVADHSLDPPHSQLTTVSMRHLWGLGSQRPEPPAGQQCRQQVNPGAGLRQIHGPCSRSATLPPSKDLCPSQIPSTGRLLQPLSILPPQTG